MLTLTMVVGARTNSLITKELIVDSVKFTVRKVWAWALKSSFTLVQPVKMLGMATHDFKTSRCPHSCSASYSITLDIDGKGL